MAAFLNFIFFCSSQFFFLDLSTTTANTNQRPVSAPISSTNTTDVLSNDRVKDTNDVVTLSLRRPKNSDEDKGKDKHFFFFFLSIPNFCYYFMFIYFDVNIFNYYFQKMTKKMIIVVHKLHKQ